MVSFQYLSNKQSMYYKGIISLVMLFFLISCNTNQKEFSPPTFERNVNLKHSVIQDTILLNLPREIITFDKYVVMNVLSDGKYLHVFDKLSGEYLGGYVSRGQGPGEIATWCERLDYNKKERKITMIEKNTNQCFIYSVNDDSESLLSFDSKKNFSSNSTNKEGFERISGIFKIDKNLYLTDSRIFPPTKNRNRRFSLITETGEKMGEYNSFATDDFWAYSGGQSPKISISPNRMKMAHATFIGAVLETFEIGSSINLIHEKLFYPIILDIRNETAYPTDETIIGFSDICTSDEYIFSILCGSKESNNRNISVFNWDADPVIRFETNIDIYNICYNEDDHMIYAIAITEDYKYILVKFDISSYLQIQ